MIIPKKHYRIRKIRSTLEAWQLINGIISGADRFDRDKETFFTIGLNSANKIIYIDLVSLGALNATLVYPREVFRRAILQGAARIIVAHNHPSGNCSPSKSDIKLTKTLVRTGKIIAIPVLDHIIVTRRKFYSFAYEKAL